MSDPIRDATEVLGAVHRETRAKPAAVVQPSQPACSDHPSPKERDTAAHGPVQAGSTKRAKVRPYVLIDTREQRALRFPPELGVDCGAATLPAGDYSVRGFTHLIALERKSVSDLVQTLSHGRERFENELDLLAEYRWKAILIEGDQADIEGHVYRSNMLPKSVLGSLRAFYMRWGVPHFWCTDPAGAAQHVAWFARRLEEKHADLKEKTDAEELQGVAAPIGQAG